MAKYSEAARKRERIHNLYKQLTGLGFTWAEIDSLLRIERTLGNWSTEECNGTIQRDDETEKPFRVYGQNHEHREPIADREAGARRRLDAIMAQHPELAAYIQGDPRGCALYIYRKDDPILKREYESKNGISCCYSSVGVAVCI